MYNPNRTSFRGASHAILIAGPLFVSLVLATMLYAQLPQAIAIDLKAIAALPVILLLAAIFGPFIACIPIAIGTVAMHGLSRSCRLLDSPLIWLLTGAAIGTGTSYATGLFDESREIAFALITTCAACARLAYGRRPA